MTKRVPRLVLICFVLCLAGCNNVTYRPHSAKQKYFARPHLLFMDAVVRFREFYGVWPAALNDLSSVSETNRKIINDFQYLSADFESSNQDKLKVKFYNYKKDLAISKNNDNQVDLNAFHGVIYFFKSNGKFVWKVKMK